MKKLILAGLVAALPATPLEAGGAFEDVTQLDVQVAAHLGANIGEPGGAMTPIDRRLRLQRCPGAVQIDIPSSRYATVRCAEIGWRIRVPMSPMTDGVMMTGAGPATTNATAAKPEMDARPMVLRGTQVQLVVERPGFSVSTYATSLGQGAMGEEIRVRMPDSHTMRTARVTGPSQAILLD